MRRIRNSRTAGLWRPQVTILGQTKLLLMEWFARLLKPKQIRQFPQQPEKPQKLRNAWPSWELSSPRRCDQSRKQKRTRQGTWRHLEQALSLSPKRSQERM